MNSANQDQTSPSNPATLLTSREVPRLSEDQLSRFTNPESIHAGNAGHFNPAAAIEQLSKMVGERGVAFECGGGSVRGGSFTVSDGGKVQLDNDFKVQTEKSETGEGFLKKIEEIAEYAKNNGLSVGMAYGGPIEQTRPLFHPKIKTLMEELGEKYDGDFANIFSTPFSVLNDGPAGLVSASVEAKKGHTEDPVVAYLINGGGLGLGVYKNGNLIMTESGHVEVSDELNPNKVTRSCGIYGDYVCLENVASNKQGLEKQWESITGEKLNGLEIENRLKAGDELAKNLFELTATAQATVIAGAARALNIDVNDPLFEVVVHGSTQRTPGLKERTAQILWQDSNTNRKLLFTEEYSANACIDGAAIALLTLQK